MPRTDDNEETVYFLLNSDNIYDKTGHYDLLLLKNTFHTTQLSNQLHDTQLLNPKVYKYTTDEISKQNKDNKYILPTSKQKNENCIVELSNYETNHNNINNVLGNENKESMSQTQYKKKICTRKKK